MAAPKFGVPPPEWAKHLRPVWSPEILAEGSSEDRQQRKCWMNPYGLKSIGFQKALDPYTAYQELSMWVGGVLAGESPKLVKITSDRILLEGHGFDNVVSFRGPRLK